MTPLPARLSRRPVRDPHDQRRRATASTRCTSTATASTGVQATVDGDGNVRGDAAGHAPLRRLRASSPASSRAAPAAPTTPGDYLYYQRHRPAVQPGRLGPDPGAARPVPPPAAAARDDRADGPALPTPTGGRPPVVASAGQPVPADAPARAFESGRRPPDAPGGRAGHPRGFVPSSVAADVEAGRISPSRSCSRRRGRLRDRPAHQRAGDGARLLRSRQARPHAQLVGHQRRLQPRADGRPRARSARTATTPTRRRSAARVIADFGDFDSGTQGLYGAFVVAPAGRGVRRPAHGPPARRRRPGRRAAPGRRRLPRLQPLLFDNDAVIGANTMPYPTAVEGRRR